MSMTVTADKKLLAQPVTLKDWRHCEADLRQRYEANAAERDRIAVLRQALALNAARGDASAQKKITRLAARAADLALAAVSLDQGLAVAAQEIGIWETRAAMAARAADCAQLHDKLAARLALVTEAERQIRAVVPLLDHLAALTGEIEQAHAALGGQRPVLPPLAQEAVGGRLAEFMAGSGFAAWLPLARPEIRPALASWVAAEQDIQKSYHLAT